MSYEGDPIVDAVLETIPGVDELFEKTIEILKVKGFLHPEKIESEFWNVLKEFENTAYHLYKEHAKLAMETLKSECIKRLPKDATITSAFESAFPLVVQFERRAAQSRKSRGGSTFEKVIPYLLERIHIKCEKPIDKADKQFFKYVDLIIPSIALARERPDQAVYISFKRTLRERWKQVVDEKSMGFVYLITFSDDRSDLTPEKIKQILEHKIILYVPNEVKEWNYLKNKSQVRKIDDLPADLKKYKN
jgi:hypothetical protein